MRFMLNQHHFCLGKEKKKIHVIIISEGKTIKTLWTEGRSGFQQPDSFLRLKKAHESST